MWDPYAEFESITLQNGITIHVLNLPGRPFEAVGFLINSGSQQDPVGLEGLAHFTEHLVSYNAGMEKNDIDSFFHDCGGIVCLGETSDFYTNYKFFLPINDRIIVSKAFSIFGDMLISSNIEKNIEIERNVIIEEFNREYPLYFKFDLELKEQKALYGGYWLERSTSSLGNLDSIKKISQNDLQSFYDNHYTPVNIDIICVGGMTLSEVKKIILESSFAKNKIGVKTSVQGVVKKFADLLENFNVIDMSAYYGKDVLKAASYCSTANIPGDVSRSSISILDEMLSNILNHEIREKRSLTYDIYSDWSDFRHFYSFYIKCEAFSPTAVNDMEKIVCSCIESIPKRNDLFKQIKKRAIARSFMVDSTARGICDSAMYNISSFGKIVSLDEDRKNIERVEMSDIIDLLKWLTPERRWTVIGRP